MHVLKEKGHTCVMEFSRITHSKVKSELKNRAQENIAASSVIIVTQTLDNCTDEELLVLPNRRGLCRVVNESTGQKRKQDVAAQ